MSSSVSEEKDDERKRVLIKGSGTPAEEREEERANEGVDVMSDQPERRNTILKNRQGQH